MTSAGMRAFVDESSCVRTDTTQEYLIGAAIVTAGDCDEIREALRHLRLPGQIKPHWTDESDRRRRTITETIADLGSMHVVVAHLSGRNRKTERHRRKCLETLYYELGEADVLDITLERRSDSQDKQDRAHIVSLQNQGWHRGLRISHCRGGDDPLLWIPDAVLGAVNASFSGDVSYIDVLRGSILIEKRTPESLMPESGQSERP
ncbi:MAG: hypothetical protein Q7T31_16455 [Dietzia sp.]|jgi:hypothetical protein|uniref:DUF3800 domain-containing protein n=1 Tax=Dietzia maris TaxID=37915 RepID=A0A365P8X9_9ACTN|nr:MULTISPECIES: hypothetical protein [Dietzia]MCZ4657700.1 hypothetical protein [Dietzia kunjamensis]MDJ0424184.1 hypothetical protein [Dietzia kunjamensis]MDN4507779.1 hypothetical protein [Dietzia maris]MDO8395966.1 hypothetical protein [Dietzia sp.]MDV3357335.1 hypothetical protein [Dietzia sp. IN118]